MNRHGFITPSYENGGALSLEGLRNAIKPGARGSLILDRPAWYTVRSL
jgi:hypothetical protein